MTYNTLLIEDLGAIRRITVNRPDKLNALNRETLCELQQAFDAVRAADEIRVVVLRGAGSKAFVAGADISELTAMSPAQSRDFSRLGQRMMHSIETLGKPVIAEIGGFALGGGMELAMCCHLRLASDKARFGQPEINLGLIPGFGGTQRLLRLVGRTAALHLCLTGAQIDAQRAYQLGIVNQVIAPEVLEAETLKLAEQLAASAPQALRGMLDAILIGGECSISVGLDYETQAFAVCFGTEDMREGTQAFLQRRKANFSGR